MSEINYVDFEDHFSLIGHERPFSFSQDRYDKGDESNGDYQGIAICFDKLHREDVFGNNIEKIFYTYLLCSSHY